MTYRSLFTIFTGTKTCARTLEATIELARVHKAHIEVLCLSIEQAQPHSVTHTNRAPLAYDLHSEPNLSAANKQVNLYKNQVEVILNNRGCPWSLVCRVVSPCEMQAVIADAARFADLVVLPQPGGDAKAYEAEQMLTAILYDSAAAVLTLPYARTQHFHERIALLWDNNPHSVHALRAAMPFFHRATEVDLLMVSFSAKSARAQGGGLSTMLHRHDIKARITPLSPDPRELPCELQQHVSEYDNDLLVIGAHQRRALNVLMPVYPNRSPQNQSLSIFLTN